MSNEESNLINNYINLFDSLTHYENGVEFWYARDLMEPLGYKEYYKFQNAIERAKQSCISFKQNVDNHFINVQRQVDLGSGAIRIIDDVMLSRYGAYLISINGDTKKKEVSIAQAYFLSQTRKLEEIESAINNSTVIELRKELLIQEKNLSSNLIGNGFDKKGIAILRSKGDEALFGGYNTAAMKEKYNIPKNRALSDFVQPVVLFGKAFAAELTNQAIKNNTVAGKDQITDMHIDNNLRIRNDMANIGIRPEDLPPSEDIRKIEHRLNNQKRFITASNLVIDEPSDDMYIEDQNNNERVIKDLFIYE